MDLLQSILNKTPRYTLAAITLASASIFSSPICSAQDTKPSPSIQADLVYGHKDGLAMTMDLYEPIGEPNGAALMFMVSGGWVSIWAPPESLEPLFHPFLERGYKVFSVRHGSSPRYLIPDAVQDVRQALSFVATNAEKYGFDPNRIGVLGFSAGGHLSLMLGTTTNQPTEGIADSDAKVAAVASVFAPTDLKPYMESTQLSEQFPALKFDASQGETYSPLFHATKDDAATLLIHGDKDDLVPHFHSEKMHQSFLEAEVPTELVIIKGAGHAFDEAGKKQAFDAMIQWFDKHLLK